MTDKTIAEPMLNSDAVPNAEPSVNAAGTAEFSIPYILAQMAALQSDTAYIHNALDSLLGITSGKHPMDTVTYGPNPVASAAEAVGKIVASREATNQQLLKIYDHLLFQLIGLQEEKEKGTA